MDHFLASVEPFKRLPPAERQRLVKTTREQRYTRGETIFREGQPSDSVWSASAGTP